MAIYKDDKGYIHGGRRKNITGSTSDVRRRGGPLVYNTTTGKAVDINQARSEIRKGVANAKRTEARDRFDYDKRQAFVEGRTRAETLKLFNEDYRNRQDYKKTRKK